MLKLYYDHTTFHPYHTFKVMLKYRKNKPIKNPQKTLNISQCTYISHMTFLVGLYLERGADKQG